MKREIFPNDPIKEVLISIDVKLPDGFEAKEFINVYNELRDNFPEKKQRFKKQGTLRFTDLNVEVKEEQSKIDGYQFYSKDKKKVVQYRLDGFTFNILKPYQEWENFRNEAKELWSKYTNIIKPSKLIKLELRYINCIEIPLTAKKLNEYILMYPEISPELQYEWSDFLLRILFRDNQTGAIGIVTELIDKTENTGILPLIFDINVFIEKNIDFSSYNEDIWLIIDKLKNFNNNIFFKSITEKTRDLFR